MEGLRAGGGDGEWEDSPTPTVDVLSLAPSSPWNDKETQITYASLVHVQGGGRKGVPLSLITNVR